MSRPRCQKSGPQFLENGVRLQIHTLLQVFILLTEYTRWEEPCETGETQIQLGGMHWIHTNFRKKGLKLTHRKFDLGTVQELAGVASQLWCQRSSGKALCPRLLFWYPVDPFRLGCQCFGCSCVWCHSIVSRVPSCRSCCFCWVSSYSARSCKFWPSVGLSAKATVFPPCLHRQWRPKTSLRASSDARRPFPGFSWLGETWSTQQTGRANALASSQTTCLAWMPQGAPQWGCLLAGRRPETPSSVRPMSPKRGSGATWAYLPGRFHLRTEGIQLFPGSAVVNQKCALQHIVVHMALGTQHDVWTDLQ